MRLYFAIAIPVLMSLAPTSVVAQGLDGSGSGHDLAMPTRARFTTATGQTVPKPDALDPMVTGSIRSQNPRDDRDDAIMQSICNGCLH